MLERLCRIPWHVLRGPVASGPIQMALDAHLLQRAVTGEGPFIRLYGWSPPAVSLGRFQPADAVPRGPLADRGWDLVRRPTGGRAVLHQHEVTYAIALPPRILGEIGIADSYRVLAGLIHAAVSTLTPTPIRTPSAVMGGRNAANCFALADLADGVTTREPLGQPLGQPVRDGAGAEVREIGGKVVGSAQVRQAGALLQHGSILLAVDRDAVAELFGSVGRAVGLRDLIGGSLTAEQVERAVLSTLISTGISLLDPAESGIDRAALLRSAANFAIPIEPCSVGAV